MSQNPFLITPADLVDHLGKPGLSVIDASWYLPAQNRLGRREFEAAHVPGAVFFDQDEVVDPASDLPHTLPPPEVFAAAMGELGISETDTIVVYDGVGLLTAPRVWWLLRTFGAKDVRVLDGGFPAWLEAELPVETGAVSAEPTTFAVSFDRGSVASLEEVKAAVATGRPQIADARPTARFSGEAPEPRDGVRAGHMPGAFNLPFTALSQDGRLKSEAALRAICAEVGLDPDAPIVTSCGSGVTAAVLNLALESLGNRQCALYDGSWTEWGSAADTPVETGR